MKEVKYRLKTPAELLDSGCIKHPNGYTHPKTSVLLADPMFECELPEQSDIKLLMTDTRTHITTRGWSWWKFMFTRESMCECGYHKHKFMFHERWCPEFVHPFDAPRVTQEPTYKTESDHA